MFCEQQNHQAVSLSLTHTHARTHTHTTHTTHTHTHTHLTSMISFTQHKESCSFFSLFYRVTISFFLPMTHRYTRTHKTHAHIHTHTHTHNNLKHQPMSLSRLIVDFSLYVWMFVSLCARSLARSLSRFTYTCTEPENIMIKWLIPPHIGINPYISPAKRK